MNSSTMEPSNPVQGMFDQGSESGPPASNSHVETQRSTDPHVSLEDYNRTMLEYTQRQMSSFVDLDDSRGGGSTSGRSGSTGGNSNNSGRSGTSNGVATNQTSAPPTSASAAAAKRHNLQQGNQQSVLSPNESNHPRY